MKMAEVAKAEGMPFYRATVEDISKRLELIAEICRCDMRKILNSMQLFRHAKPRKCSSKGPNDVNISELLPTMQGSTLSTVVADRPLIRSVEPRLVFKDKHTLITISGENFTSTSTNLLIDGRLCNHFRIISDSKIIAACPPCVIPDGVTEEAIYEDEFSKSIDCLSCKFIDVAVTKKCSNGLILHSNSLLAGTRTHESHSWTLEYDIPLREDIWEMKTTREDFIRKLKAQKLKQTDTASDNDAGLTSFDDEELEFDTKTAESCNTRQRVDSKKISTGNKSNCDGVHPQTLLDEAMNDLRDTQEISTTKSLVSPETSRTTFREIKNLAEDYRRLSDAILLEDAFTDLAVPLLAGSVEGFGFDTLESLSCIDSLSCADPMIDKLSKEKNKKP